MQNIGESMAGRAGILRLAPFSNHENPRVSAYAGGYPEALTADNAETLWFSSYIQTYLERDVRSILAVRNLPLFHRFLQLLATRHGQMLNKTDIATGIGISVPTVGEWLGVLEMSGILLRVPPYFRNAGKRLVKSPKIYFLDSGLVCHLLGIRSESDLSASPFAGAVFEGFVVSEVCKMLWASGRQGDVYYFRDEQGLEVDLLFSPNEGRLVMAECKSSATVVPSMARPMRQLADSFRKEGVVVENYLVHQPSPTGSSPRSIAPGVTACSLRDFIQKALMPCL